MSTDDYRSKHPLAGDLRHLALVSRMSPKTIMATFSPLTLEAAANELDRMWRVLLDFAAAVERLGGPPR